jgi:hypothetical protein
VIDGSAAVKIAPKLMGKDKELVRATLEKVVANTKNQRTKRDAERLLGPAAKGK